MSFFRTIASPLFREARKVLTGNARRQIHHLSFHHCSEEDLDAKFVEFFNKPDLDGWDVRQGMNDILGLDMVPNPEICVAVLYACRRINDFSCAIRFLEAVKDKCGPKHAEIYPYIIQEIMPVLVELGVETPEELGYDKPELCLENVYDIH